MNLRSLGFNRNMLFQKLYLQTISLDARNSHSLQLLSFIKRKKNNSVKTKRKAFKKLIISTTRACTVSNTIEVKLHLKSANAVNGSNQDNSNNHLWPGLKSATIFTIFRFRSNFYDFSLVLRFFTSHQQKVTNFTFFAIFRAVKRFFAVFFLANYLMTTEVNRLADFTKVAKFRSLNDFSRCVTIFRSLLSC